MSQGNDSEKSIVGGTGITAGGNVSIDNVNGQIAIGLGNTQEQKLYSLDFGELRLDLLSLKEAIVNSNISQENKEILEGDMSVAIKETKKEKHVLSKIVSRFESVIEVLNESKKLAKESGLYDFAVKIATKLGIEAVMSNLGR